MGKGLKLLGTVAIVLLVTTGCIHPISRDDSKIATMKDAIKGHWKYENGNHDEELYISNNQIITWNTKLNRQSTSVHYKFNSIDNQNGKAEIQYTLDGDDAFKFIDELSFNDDARTFLQDDTTEYEMDNNEVLNIYTNRYTYVDNKEHP